MKIIITINLDNVVFDGNWAEEEVDYILDTIRQEYKGTTREGMREWRSFMLRDSNGNRVGGVEVTK